MLYIYQKKLKKNFQHKNVESKVAHVHIDMPKMKSVFHCL